MFKAYKITPYDQEINNQQPQQQEEPDIMQILKSFEERLKALEQKKGGRLDELL